MIGNEIPIENIIPFSYLVYQPKCTPVFVKFVLPSYGLSFSKTENVKEESIVKIGIQNFARSGISGNSFSQKGTSKVSYALFEASHAGEREVLNGAGNWGVFSKIKMKITSIDADGWLMGKYVNGELQVAGDRLTYY